MKLNYEFKNTELLDLALTQSGIDGTNNNERLEFVGDRVLGLAVADMLYNMYPTESEGELARRHAMLVSTETLANIGTRLGLNGALRHGHMTGGRMRHSIANATEAVLGAMYFDAGFDVVREFILDIWHDLALMELNPPKDAKTTLQELVQKQTGGQLPVYTCVERTGASHCPTFCMSVTALGQTETGTGPSKKAAGIAAAAALLKKLAI